MEIRFIGHATFELVSGDHRVLVDPFLAPNNPTTDVTASDVSPTDVLLTHSHADHAADAVEVAKSSGASCVAVIEIGNWLEDNGVEDVVKPNLGGTVERDWGWVRFVPALHSNSTPDGTTVGIAAGLVINMGGVTVYHLGDTCLFSDLGLVSERDDLNVALIPIGGHFTMDQEDAVTAAELLDADVVIPMHYENFPPVKADVERYKADVEASSRTSSEVVILKPGETYEV
jgi:L-ascorbate metabolism protein UlaG (beta-lactamase superfamily)